MEPEPIVTEPTKPENIEPHVVVEGEDKVESNMVEASEPEVHQADTIKVAHSKGQEPKDEGNESKRVVENGLVADTDQQANEHPEGQQHEVPANVSSCEPSDASVVKAEVETPHPETGTPVPESKQDNAQVTGNLEEDVPTQSGLHQAVSQNDSVKESGSIPDSNEPVGAVPLIVVAQKDQKEITVCPGLPEDQQQVFSIRTEEEETIIKVEDSSRSMVQNEIELETAVEIKEDEFAVQKGHTGAPTEQLKVVQSDFILPKPDEAEKESVPVVTIDPASGEEITVRLEKPSTEEEAVPATESKTEPGLAVKKSVSTSSLDKTATEGGKKRRRFHFSFHRGKEGKGLETRKADSLDRSSHRAFGTSVKTAWDNFSKTLKRKEKSAEPVAVKPRPPRPPPVAPKFTEKTHLHGNELDQQSLQSLSAVSISNSPIVARKHLIQEALPDFMEALPAGSMEVSAEYNKENHAGGMHANQERILSWTAAQVAGTTAQEATIQPAQRQHPYYSGDYGRIRVTSGAGSHPSPKPPRPTSPPSLSPLDYQPYHSEDGLSQSDIVQRRINLVQAMTPPGSSTVGLRSPGSQVSGGNRPYTTSLDRRQQAEIDYRGSPNVRRAQTLRTDYANRLRERVLSLRVEPGESAGEGGTLRPRKPRVKKETYVCSDTIKFPKLSFKLGRRQKEKAPAVVHPEKVDMVIPRPQPNFVSSAPGEQQRFWVQQHLTNDYELGVCGTDGYSAKWLYPKPGPQVTSLPSMAGGRYEHEKPQVLSPDSAAPECNLTTTSYISGELKGQLEQQTETEQLQEVMKMTQPFLVAWDARESENLPRDSSPEAIAQTLDCIRSYLNTCIRLRSADLQGHFAPFQYQLSSFSPRCWKNVAKFTKWDNVLVVGGAVGTTEYLQLVPAPSTKPEYFHAPRCVDLMLTNWLDRHHSNPQLVSGSREQASEATYQPISFVSNLAKLVDINPYSNTSMNALFQLSLRLAVLLTYESCLTEVCSATSNQTLKPVTKLEDIILGWSTCNCIALFRLEEKTNEVVSPPSPQETAPSPKEETPMEQETPNKEDATGSDIDMPVDEAKPSEDQNAAVDELIKSLCPEYTSVENAIDGLIDKLYETVTEQLNPAGIGSCLLKSIAPPDWIAMLVSRIAMHKI